MLHTKNINKENGKDDIVDINNITANANEKFSCISSFKMPSICNIENSTIVGWIKCLFLFAKATEAHILYMESNDDRFLVQQTLSAHCECVIHTIYIS